MAKKVNHNYEEAKLMYDKGATLSQISKALNIPLNTLKSKKAREKWTSNASSTKKKVQKFTAKKKRETFIKSEEKASLHPIEGCNQKKDATDTDISLETLYKLAKNRLYDILSSSGTDSNDARSLELVVRGLSGLLTKNDISLSNSNDFDINELDNEVKEYCKLQGYTMVKIDEYYAGTNNKSKKSKRKTEDNKKTRKS